jgi:hypothetical protein
VLATAVDVITTWTKLTAGAVEANPIARAAMHALSAPGTLLIGLALRVGIVAALVACSRAARPRSARSAAISVLVAIACWWGVVDLSNVAVLHRW